MCSNLLRTTSIVLVLLGSAALAAAQQPSPSPDVQQQSQQENAQQTQSSQSAKEEPTSHAKAARPENDAVLVNGALAVPGAAPHSDTVPAKFSEKNAADDALIIVAYTFKTLTDDERRAIYQGLKDEPAGSAYNAELGDVLPAEVALRAVSDAVDRVLLVSPPTRIVVGVFRADPEPPASVGRRAQ